MVGSGQWVDHGQEVFWDPSAKIPVQRRYVLSSNACIRALVSPVTVTIPGISIGLLSASDVPGSIKITPTSPSRHGSLL
jgi:hypothetical protein